MKSWSLFDDSRSVIFNHEYVTLEEATQQLGRVVFGAPQGTGLLSTGCEALPCDLEIVYTLSGETLPPIRYHNINQSMVINTPFAFTGNMNTCRWEARVTVTWKDSPLTYTHKSTALFPAIHNWHCRVYDRQKEQSPVYLSAQNASQLPAAHEWTLYTEDAAKIPSLAYPFYLHPWGDSYQKVVDGGSFACCLATTFLSTGEHPAKLLFFGKDEADFYINGEKVDSNQVKTGESLTPYSKHPDLTTMVSIGPFNLRRG